MGIAYPLWWNQRSNGAGQQLLARARPPASRLPSAGDRHRALATCTNADKRAFAPTARHPGVLQIAAIGLTAPVLPGLSNRVLDVAVGHDSLTVWPGQRGESILLAHDVSYFSGLDHLRAGDRITWTLGCARAIFRVRALMVSRPGAELAVAPSGYGLALVTCWPTDALFWTSERFVVTAQLIARQRVGGPLHTGPTTLLQLRVPAPPALAALGLSLSQAGVLVGTLAVTGTPTPAFRQGPEPLHIANAALRDYAAVFRTARMRNRAWWAHLAIAGVPLPAPWSLAYDTNVTLVVHGSRVQAVVLSSPVAVVRLTVRGSTLLVVSVTS